MSYSHIFSKSIFSFENQLNKYKLCVIKLTLLTE